MTDITTQDLERFNPTADLKWAATAFLNGGDGRAYYSVELNTAHGYFTIDVWAPTAVDAKLEAIRRFKAVINLDPIEGEGSK